MKDYSIRIENGHHVVNMDYNPTELELAVENLSKGIKQMAETINAVIENVERIVSSK